jgi:HMG (high mobility group) box
MSKKISELWKSLSAEDKKPYEELSAQDKARVSALNAAAAAADAGGGSSDDEADTPFAKKAKKEKAPKKATADKKEKKAKDEVKSAAAALTSGNVAKDGGEGDGSDEAEGATAAEAAVKKLTEKRKRKADKVCCGCSSLSGSLRCGTEVAWSNAQCGLQHCNVSAGARQPTSDVYAQARAVRAASTRASIEQLMCLHLLPYLLVVTQACLCHNLTVDCHQAFDIKLQQVGIQIRAAEPSLHETTPVPPARTYLTALTGTFCFAEEPRQPQAQAQQGQGRCRHSGQRGRGPRGGRRRRRLRVRLGARPRGAPELPACHDWAVCFDAQQQPNAATQRGWLLSSAASCSA